LIVPLDDEAGADVAAAVGWGVEASAVVPGTRSFIARTDQTMSSRPTLPPAMYRRASL
jgi:hypothetical protein